MAIIRFENAAAVLKIERAGINRGASEAIVDAISSRLSVAEAKFERALAKTAWLIGCTIIFGPFFSDGVRALFALWAQP